MNKKIRFALIFLIFLVFPIFSANFKIPSQTAWIMDEANVIDSQTKSELESKLENLDEKAGAQIAVLTISSLEATAGNDTTIEEYANEVFEKWRLGQAGKDNGVLLLVSVDDRKLRIEVGYGLEGVLTDTKCGIIIRRFITPYFKKGNYSEGIKNGVDTILGYVSGDEEIQSEVDEPEKSDSADFLIPILMFTAFFGIVFVSELYSRKHKSNRSSRYHRTFSNHSSRRFYYDNDSDDFGGFGGHHGGGFGGGGGGHSGGGGASGGW